MIKAPAKINLILRIKGVTPDRYHDLFMLMQEITLSDAIGISTATGDASSPLEIILQDSPVCEAKDNLCYRAVEAFYEDFGLPSPLSIAMELTKNTPSQAGLGGGSSDAASVLLFLREKYCPGLPLHNLIPTAKRLGADVPFFITGGTKICEGIGEIMTDIPSLSGLHVVIVKPTEGIPTGKCFALADEEKITYTEEYKERVMEILTSDLTPIGRIRMLKSGGLLINDLQKPACRILPGISDLIGKLEHMGAVHAAMSGSGSAVYGIFGSDSEARNAEASLKEELKDHFITRCFTGG